MWCVSALFAAPSKPDYYHLSPHIRACIMRTQSRGVDSFVRRHLAASASDGVAEGLVLKQFSVGPRGRVATAPVLETKKKKHCSLTSQTTYPKPKPGYTCHEDQAEGVDMAHS
jgi:hypothetical protein